MKRIEKGPVRGVSLKLQEEVSNYLAPNYYSGKREKNGLCSREVRDPDLRHQVQRPRRQGPHQRARNQAVRQPVQTGQEGFQVRLSLGQTT